MTVVSVLDPVRSTASPDVAVDERAASWRALGTQVDLRVDDPRALATATLVARGVLDEVDATCSRFRADSDLSVANRLAGQWVPISPVLVAALRVAIRAAARTDGLVDPCLGEVLVTAGYDRTFVQLLQGQPGGAAQLPTPPDPQAWRRLQLGGGRLLVPAGVSLDLGATGKAFAADLVAAAVLERIDGPLVVSVGGDVRAIGDPVEWPCDIATDRAALAADGPVCRVLLPSGGLAVSSVTARRWVRGGRTWHHVVDPRTARPTRGPWRAVAAYETTAALANTLTTAALVLGADAVDWLEERSAAALLIGLDGRVHRTTRWVARVREVAV